ncbi:MAG: hypothetical protein DI601_18325 [Azospirillum brasilense]|nr:MAG: hypothetical protein DI601_18325 [Azospirillum brasilense]
MRAGQLIVFLADARVGAELRKAQDAGQLATQERHPNSVRASDTAPTTLPEIGIPRQRASEMKRLAEVGEPAIRAEVKLSQMRSPDFCQHPL